MMAIFYTANLRGARTTHIYTPATDEVFRYESGFAYHGFS
jgi:hypothetical protein